MPPPVPCRAGRALIHHAGAPMRRRFYSSSPLPPPDIQGLQSRPAKFIPEYLTPSPSHLLTTTINDLLLPSVTAAHSSPIIQTPAPPLPQGHHLVYFPLQTPPSQLAPDGADLDHSPGAAYPRRLWAGGEITFRKGWQDRMRLDGRPASCKETIGDVKTRGDKVFVDVHRAYGAGHDEDGAWDVQEKRTLVFMPNDGESGQAAPRFVKYPHAADAVARLTPSTKHLFTFSALSFNAHAIHIDPEFARAEAHRGLLVHGPLSLALMLRVVNQHVGGDVEALTYRNHAPLYVDEEMSVCVRDKHDGSYDVWVQGPEGGLAIKGNAKMEDK